MRALPRRTTNQGFGNAKQTPWRAGANENTVFSVSNDVAIEGKPLAAGHHGLHMIPGENEWTLIFSKNAGAWGSFYYEDAEEALRVTVKPHKHEYREYLTYEFPVRKPTAAMAELQWEDRAVPWTISVANVDDIYISRLRPELTSVPGFSWQGFQSAAQYTVPANKNLDQGLVWAQDAISRPFVGQANFSTLSTKAQVLSKLGREKEATETLQAAIKMPSTTSLEIHQYGRQLLAENKVDEALAIFQYNAQRNGDEWPVHVGLARAYAAKGDNKLALEHARKALLQAPAALNKHSLEAMVESCRKVSRSTSVRLPECCGRICMLMGGPAGGIGPRKGVRPTIGTGKKSPLTARFPTAAREENQMTRRIDRLGEARF